MKKFFKTFLLTTLITSVAFTSVTSANSVVIRDSATGNEALEIQSLTGLYGDISFEAPKTGKALITTAAYQSDGTLLSAVTDPVDMTVGEVVEHSTRAVNSTLADYVKVFIWDKEDLSPILINPYIIHKIGTEEEKFITKTAENVKLWDTITLGDLFEESSAELNNPISSSEVSVSVSGIEYTYIKDESDWKKSTLFVDSLGTATVTITDNRLCQSSEIQFNVVEPDPVDRYEVTFKNTDKYTYRVGNVNAVSVGSLFSALEGAQIASDSVEVLVENVDGDATGSFSKNASDWTKGTVQFSGTGIVNVTIKDSLYGAPKTVTLEVINAKNITEKLVDASSYDIVLLNDVSGEATISGGRTLHGNGFTVTLPTNPVTSRSNGFWGYVVLKNGNIDNVRLVGPVYPEQYIYRVQAEDVDANTTTYFVNSVSVREGDCNITNSYISGSRSGIYVGSAGNVLISNTTVSGGAYTNIDVSGVGAVTLEDVTTIQTPVENSYGVLDSDGNVKKMMGMGVIVSNEEAELYLKGELNQYNWASQEEVTTYIPDELFSTFNTFYTNSSFETFRATRNNTEYLNYAIVYVCALDSDKLHDERNEDDAEYGLQKLTILGASGGVYTTKDVGTLTDEIYIAPAYEDEEQFRIAPVYSFDFTNKNYLEKVEGSNDYCVYSEDAVQISFDEGDTFSWDPSILTATKYGNTLPYTVTIDGTDYTGKSITFSQTGNHTATYKYTDPYNYRLNSAGELETYSVEYEKTVSIVVAAVKAAAKHAEFTFGSSSTASTTKTISNLTYIMPDISTADNSKWGSITVGSETVYYPIVEAMIVSKKYAYFPVFDGVVSITDYADGGTGAATKYSSSTTTMPGNLTVVKGEYGKFSDISGTWSNLNDSKLSQKGPEYVFKYAAGSNILAPSTPTTYSGKLCYKSPELTNARDEYYTIAQYSYKDNANTTYYYYVGYHMAAKGDGSGCVTPDTLVTMADGTKKQIKDTNVGDEVIAWNFNTGEYEIVPLSLVQIDGSGIMDVLHLYFEDGTEFKVLGEHGIYDIDLNTFIFIDKDDVEEYLGHGFVKQDGNSYKTVKLVDYKITTEDTDAYTALSAKYCNVLLGDMLTVTPALVGGNFFNPFEVGEGLKYDSDSVQADIEKYGLYTYEDFENILTKEQFDALNMSQMKVSIGKGLVTYDGIVYLIENFMN